MFHNLLNMFSNKDPLFEGVEGDTAATDTAATDTAATDTATTDTATTDTATTDTATTDTATTDTATTDTAATDTATTDTETTDNNTGDKSNKFTLLLNKFLNKDNLKMLVAFLSLFVVLYVVMGVYFRIFGMESQNSLVSSTNLIILFVITIAGFNKYYHMSDDKKNNITDTLYTTFKTNIKDIETTFGLIVLLGFIIGLKRILHLPTPEGNSSFVLDISNFLLWVVLLLNIIVIFCIDLLNIPVFRVLEDTVNSILYGKIINDEDITPEDITPEDITSDATKMNDIKPEDITSDATNTNDIVPQPAEEVFNVSNNLYSFDDAPHVCSALGARLASYDEIEDAYNKGADWCSYGWSQNQMGFFPTQKDTWQKLQSNNAMKNSCGRPGVNGGYIPNNKMKLGVNCYGIKPQASELDKERMKTSNIVPRTSKDVVAERKIAFWKDNADKMLNLNPHNKGDWSSY